MRYPLADFGHNRKKRYWTCVGRLVSITGFNKRITSANFQARVNAFEEKEVLTGFVIAKSVVGKLSFSTLAVTLSRPGALFDGKDLTIFPTSSSVTD